MARTITDEEIASAQMLLDRARTAMAQIDHYDQATVDRLCRAVAGATANEQTFGRLTRMSVEESGMGSAEGVPARRWKILGILRDALRTKSVGIIEELPEKGIVKYAKPAGVIAGLLPVTNPLVTMVNMAINAIKCKDAVIFSPHPMSRNTALEIARVLRAALRKQGAPEDLILCLERPSIPLAQELMSICDLTIATGGPAMVKAAYSSGKPAYGVGAGNATVVVDETADLADAAMNTRISKTQNHGSGCSCDGNLLVEASVYEAFLGGAERAFYYGHSYTANPLGCAAALASLDVFEEERTLERLQPKIGRMAELLDGLAESCPQVRAVRRCGFIAGIGLGARDGSRLPAAERTGERVCLAARRHGLLTRPILDTLVLMPPLCTTEDELAHAVEAIRRAIGDVLPA